MMFATLSFFLFVAFTKRKSLNSLALFAFSLDLVSYMRIEAILLVPLFVLLFFTFSEKGVWDTLRERIKMFVKAMINNTKALTLLLVFVLLLLPQVYYITSEAQNPSYGQGATQSVVSLENFKNNMRTNVQFLFGKLNGIDFYPTVFHYVIIPLAILGVLFLVFDWRKKNRFGTLILLLLWFLTYFLFYTAFYAGSATYGVDSRFMLQLLPSSCLLAAFAIIGAGDLSRWIFARRAKKKNTLRARAAYAIPVAILFLVLVAYPFVTLIPVVTIAPSAMPQQSVILRAINTFYSNYSAVPQNCLVFSFTNDIWEEVNRSSAQIGYISGGNSTVQQLIMQYKCLVFDYGYWCVVPPYHSSTCSNIQNNYELQNLTYPGEPPGGYNVTFYRILNYS
jgi:hypothetical protein